MNVRCVRCGTHFDFDDGQISESGVAVRCSDCGHVFRLRKRTQGGTEGPAAAGSGTSAPSSPSPSPPSERAWQVRHQDGRSSTHASIAALQTALSEGAVRLDDSVSLSGEKWTRIGDIAELAGASDVAKAAGAVPSIAAPLEAGEGSRSPIPSVAKVPVSDPLARSLTPSVIVANNALSSAGDDGQFDFSDSRLSATPTLNERERSAPSPSSSAAAEPGRAGFDDAASFGLGASLFDRPTTGDLPSNRIATEPESSADVPLSPESLVPAPLGLGVGPVAPTLPASPLAAASGDRRVRSAIRADAAPVAPASSSKLWILALVTAAVASALAYGWWARRAPTPDEEPVQIPSPPAPAGGLGTSAPSPAPSGEATPTDTTVPSGDSDRSPATPGTVVPDATPSGAALPEANYDALLADGHRLRRRGKFEEALKAYADAQAQAPKRAEPLVGQGSTLRDMKRLPESERAFLEALLLNPRYALAVMGLADTYRAQGKKDEALSYYRRYLELLPNGPDSSAARRAIAVLQP